MVNPLGRQHLSNPGFSNTLIADCLARNFFIEMTTLRHWANFRHQE